MFDRIKEFSTEKMQHSSAKKLQTMSFNCEKQSYPWHENILCISSQDR